MCIRDRAFADVRVLEDVSLSLAAGEVVSLLGPSGCGKSTLLRIAAGLDQDYQGGLELNPLLNFGRGSGIGVVFQEPRLMPWLSVAQNVGFADGWVADDQWIEPVSYTHLDVYKRQGMSSSSCRRCR